MNVRAGWSSARLVQRAQRPSAARSGSLWPRATRTRSPHRDEHCGEQRERREGDGNDRQDHAQRHRTEHHDGNHEHCSEGQDYGEGGEEHGLAGGGKGVGDGVDGVVAVLTFLAVAGNDEQAVVDPHRETDHHREVHGPHRQWHGPAEQVQRREPDRDSGERQHQRKAGRDGRPECHQQQQDRGQTGQELGLVERLGRLSG